MMLHHNRVLITDAAGARPNTLALPAPTRGRLGVLLLLRHTMNLKRLGNLIIATVVARIQRLPLIVAK